MIGYRLLGMAVVFVVVSAATGGQLDTQSATTIRVLSLPVAWLLMALVTRQAEPEPRPFIPGAAVRCPRCDRRNMTSNTHCYACGAAIPARK